MIGEAGRVYIYIYIRRPTTNDTPKNSETAVGAINLLLRLINRRLHSFSPIGIFAYWQYLLPRLVVEPSLSTEKLKEIFLDNENEIKAIYI